MPWISYCCPFREVWLQWQCSSLLILPDYGSRVREQKSQSHFQKFCFFVLFLLKENPHLFVFSGWKQESQINSSHSGRNCERGRIVSINSENLNVFQAKAILINLHASPQTSKYSLSSSRRLLRCVPVFTSAPFFRLAPYRGWFPVICSLCCSNFVYFYCFHCLKASWLKGKQSAPSTDLIIGIAAGEVVIDKNWHLISDESLIPLSWEWLERTPIQ